MSWHFDQDGDPGNHTADLMERADERRRAGPGFPISPFNPTTIWGGKHPLENYLAGLKRRRLLHAADGEGE